MSLEEPSLFKQIRKGVRDTVLQVPEIERKVKQTTSNDKWGPHTKDMQELARATFSYNDFPLIMNAIWKRFDEPGKHWRHVYKALLLLEYLIKNGSEQVVREAKVHLLQIKTLKDFQYIDEERKDVGLSVRERAKKLIELLNDDAMIASEREKASKNAGKYTGVSSDDYAMGGGGFGGGGGGGNGSYRDRDGHDLEDEDGNNSSEKKWPDPDDDIEEAPKPKPKPKKTEKAEKADGSRPRAPSGGATSTPAPAAAASPPAIAAAPATSVASLFADFGSTPAPAPTAGGGFAAFGGDPFAAAPKPAVAGGFAADPFGSAPFGTPAASSFGAPAASPFGAAPATAAPAFGFGGTPFGTSPAQQQQQQQQAQAALFAQQAQQQQQAALFAQQQQQQAAAAAAQQQQQMQFAPFASATPAAGGAAGDKKEAGLLADETLKAKAHLWDLGSLGAAAQPSADAKKKATPMGAIATSANTGPVRKF